MSIVDNALKVSATVCLATVTVGMCAIAGLAIKEVPATARSIRMASNNIGRAAYSANKMIINVDAFVVDAKNVAEPFMELAKEISGLAIDTKQSIVEVIKKLIAKIDDFKPEKYEDSVNTLVVSAAYVLYALANKIEDLKLEGLNDAVAEINSIAKQILDDFATQKNQSVNAKESKTMLSRLGWYLIDTLVAHR